MNCEKSVILMRRDNQSAGGHEREGHSHKNESTKAHNYGVAINGTEYQSSKNESFASRTSSRKNYTQHSQVAQSVSKSPTDFTDHSKQQSQGSLISDHTSNDTYSTGTASGYPSSNSSSSLLSNSSDPSSILSSKIKEFLNRNHAFSNHTANTTFTRSSSSNISAATSSNSSSLEHLQPLTADQPPHDTHSKIKVWCIGIGSLMAFICVAAAMTFARKRLKLKGSVAFLRRRFRSNSNDSNRAVRDRSSIGVHFRTTEPSSVPSTFSRKPLVLRPESSSYVRSSSPRRLSLLHLRDQSLKSQISSPIIEPPFPADYQPLSGGSPGKAMPNVSSCRSQPSSQSMTSLPSYHQSRKYFTSLSKNRPRLSLNRDSGIRRGNVLPIAPRNASRCGGEKSDPTTDKTPVPPRPPRPALSLLPCSSVGISTLSKPIEEMESVFPTILPLKVSRRPRNGNKHNRRHNSIDQVILDPPASYAFQDSPTLPQFQHEERNSALSITRGADPARVSQLSRSTCYSQSSDPENYSIPEENHNPDSDKRSSLRLMSFGMSRSSAKLEQQLDSFVSNNMLNDTRFACKNEK